MGGGAEGDQEERKGRREEVRRVGVRELKEKIKKWVEKQRARVGVREWMKMGGRRGGAGAGERKGGEAGAE